MKSFTPVVLLALLAGCSSRHEGTAPSGQVQPQSTQLAGHGGMGDHPAAGEHANGTLVVRTDPAEPAVGQPTTLRLMIHDANGMMVKDFAVVHEQKVHLIIVRNGLDTFAHLHPEIDAAGTMTASYTFPTGGIYWLYADHQPVGGTEGTVRAEINVKGAAPPAPPLTPDVPGKVRGDGLVAQITVENAKGGMATIRFELTDAAGQPISDLQPYMGAMGHLVVLSSDGRQYVHSHPAEGASAKPTVVAFQVHFPQGGIYKGWGQFRWKGAVNVVPFVMRVE
jgi:hypothetical protein